MSGTTPGGTRPRTRRLAWIAGAVALVVVLLALWLVFGGERAQESSEDAARQRLGAAGASGTTVPERPPFAGTPQPGLYRFAGSGKEDTSLPPLSEQQGPGMPVTVMLDGDDCWVFQIDLNTHHWQNWTYCAAHGELHEKKSVTFTRKTFGTANIENTSTFVCDAGLVVVAAGDKPGATRSRSCKGTGTFVPQETTAKGPSTIVGNETVDVAGHPTPATHVRYQLDISGGQTGNQTTDMWFAPTGMLVRIGQRVTIDTESPIGRVHYTEEGDYTLQTPAPV